MLKPLAVNYKKMKTYKLIISLTVLTILIFNTSCNNKNSNSNDVEDYYSEDDGYEDGTYCADVTYYNPNTGTNNTYTLEVEIENNELITIYWGNGGWLDEDHFSAEELDGNGYCSFTSDRGYEYEIQITGKDCGYTDQTSFQNDVEADEEENTCSCCGAYEYGVYGGLCSNCQEDDEEDNEKY